MMQAQRGQETGKETGQETALLASEHALLARFGELPANLQEMILRQMYALERTERAARYRARNFGFRFTDFVSEATENELFDAVENWWRVRNEPPLDAQHSEQIRARQRPIEQRLQRCLGAVVADFSGAGGEACAGGCVGGKPAPTSSI
jgi:hypothetical protein